MDLVYNEIDRKRYFLTAKELADHVREIGEAIAADSEQIRLEPNNVQSIAITALIKPDTELTTIKYEIERRADPRVKGE